MTESICEVVENVQPGRVFVVEDGGVWFSGMNANVGILSRRVRHALQEAGYTVGRPRSDGADEFPGVFLPVEEAESVPDEIHNTLVSSPGGDRGQEATPGP